MTAVLAPPGPRPRLRRDRRRWVWGAGAVAVVVWSLAGAGLFSGPVVNPAGLRQFGRFASAALSPALDAEFLAVLGRATLVTVAYAASGTALALVLGALGAGVVARTTWGRRRTGWTAARGLLALPRGLHEAVWGLLLVNVLGLDPWVGVLAIGIPYGAITAKVFADLLDEVPRGSYEALLAAGAGRATASLYGLLPPAAGGLLSYSFYRLECAVRSAVVLGLIGAGGLGYQLALSFASLRWDEVWTAVFALAALCALADVGGRAVRRRVADPRPAGEDRPSRDRLLTTAVLGSVALVAWSWWYLALTPATLTSAGTLEQLSYVLGAAWPPATDGDLLGAIASAAVDTLQMSVIAIALATAGAVLLSGLAARRPGAGPGRWALGVATRWAFLVPRAVPPPVWALVLLFVLLPGVLPGALALGVYTLGVLGRLVAEATEELDSRPRDALRAAGASPLGGWLYGVLPVLSGPVLALGLYRWEVAIRDTVLVGLLGAGGIGVLLSGAIAAFDWPAVTTVLAAIVLVTLVVDLVGERARTALR
ncbi:PhnE/PtxC family ABC transporter permease [Blastococcus xanthinilyticus]|uniref:Phosphonate transport system permease protein n=1 Tax=Blastococcus xanthinilyticus TaxID=1564164 RepID=A0A5S5CXC5_9ACTN|nr:ABC transporter permease subunit [Blastococcus xanthinilyticus]TYP87496.1 phosphonate transport system permease protein [Blastococcus xanthinilyticus]